MNRFHRMLAYFGLVTIVLFGAVQAQEQSSAQEVVKVAALTTEFRPNSHSEVQIGRLIRGFNLNDTGDQLDQLELVSMYTDQVPDRDLSRQYSEEYGFPIYETIRGALTLGTGELAVDAVYIAYEHGDYPMSESGNKMYPKRQAFEEVVEVFRESGRVVPVFMDKHLADNWEDAKWIYDTAQEMGIPMMGGSSLPVGRRMPNIEISDGTNVEEVVGIFQGGLDGHSFHVLEFIQSLVEDRAGGVTGISRVRGLSGDEVWEAGENGGYSTEVLLAALSRLNAANPGYYTEDDLEWLRETVENPTVFLLEYDDGMKVSLFSLPGVSSNYVAAWRTDEENKPIQSALADLQYARPYTHHGNLVQNAMQMFITGEPGYPIERTLLVSGAVDASLISLNLEDSEWVETPYLEFTYESDWDFQQPARYTPDRTMQEDFPD
ncbi:MAG: hypothetical protein WD273_10840 [Trueperaceae bacterium]